MLMDEIRPVVLDSARALLEGNLIAQETLARLDAMKGGV